MEKLIFKTEIDANREKVWQTMLQPDTFKEWTNVSFPGTYYIGNWKQGEKIQFTGPGGGGTVATIDELKLFDHILARHTAVLNTDGTEDLDSDIAKGWIGTTERYSFTEQNGKTQITVEVHTTPEWAGMFNNSWPASLQELKKICER